VSVETMAIALHHSRATGTAKLILLGIANHDGDGGAYPSLRTLAKYGGCNVRNARKALERLVALGEVRVFVQAGGLPDWDDHLRPNRYEVLLMCPPACDRTKNHRMPREDRLWTDPRSESTGGSVATGGPPVGSDPLTVHEQPAQQVGASTTDRARETRPCDGCGLALEQHVLAVDRGSFEAHDFTPTPRRGDRG
jgi:hypothetical protein